MCEYCGCQALDAVATLTAEHDELVDLLGRARVALDAGDPASVAVLLRVHLLAEQDGVFPAAVASLSARQWADVDAVRREVGSARRAALRD